MKDMTICVLAAMFIATGIAGFLLVACYYADCGEPDLATAWGSLVPVWCIVSTLLVAKVMDKLS